MPHNKKSTKKSNTDNDRLEAAAAKRRMTMNDWFDEQYQALGEDIKKWDRWIDTGVPQK
jgi:hypothetical protein